MITSLFDGVIMFLAEFGRAVFDYILIYLGGFLGWFLVDIVGLSGIGDYVSFWLKAAMWLSQIRGWIDIDFFLGLIIVYVGWRFTLAIARRTLRAFFWFIPG